MCSRTLGHSLASLVTRYTDAVTWSHIMWQPGNGPLATGRRVATLVGRRLSPWLNCRAHHDQL